MRESIGGTQVLMIGLTILIIMIVVLCASISYSKAFKARNAVVNIIQKHAKRGESISTLLDPNIENGAYNEINRTLENMGYMKSAGAGKKCDAKEKKGYDLVESKSYDLYNFCIYRYQDKKGNEIYGVQTYMYFELPIFGRNDRFSFPIYGETFTFFNVID